MSGRGGSTGRPWRAAAFLAAVGLAAAGLAACAGQAPVAEGPEVRAWTEVDREAATVGDLITYSLTVDHLPGLAVQIPEPAAAVPEGLRVADAGRDATRREGGRVIERRWVELRADRVGSWAVPAVEVSYRSAVEAGGAAAAEDASEGTAEGTVTAPEVTVSVESVLPADGSATDIRDLKPLRDVDPGPPPWAIALAATALLALVGWMHWRRRRAAAHAAAPALPQHEIARRALDDLAAADPGDPEAVRRFYFRLSEVVRAYVEGRFGLNATDLTTEEILPALGGLDGLPPAAAERLGRLLVGADRVKFAARVPAGCDVEASLAEARWLVEATRPRPQPEEAAA